MPRVLTLTRGRMWLRVLILALLALVASQVAGARPAEAGGPPPIYCFTYQDNPAPPVGYVPIAAYRNCNVAVIQYTAPNQYWVDLQGVYRPNGIPHVTAVTNPGDPTWCQLVDWFQSPTGAPDAIVHVACFRPGGIPVASRFSLTYAANVGALPPGAGYGYLWYAGGVKVWLNSAGPAPVVGVVGVGLYQVIFPGLGTPNPQTGGIQVTAVASSAARCKVSGWNTAAGAQVVFNVACVDGNGNPAPEGWTATYQDQVDLTGRAIPANTRFGCLMANGGAPPLFANFNAAEPAPGLGFNAVTAAPPYTVQFPLIALHPDNAQVTAFDQSADYCHFTQVAFPWLPAVTTAVVPRIECFNSVGAVMPDPFFVEYTSVGP